jgi:hypothetical protein
MPSLGFVPTQKKDNAFNLKRAKNGMLFRKEKREDINTIIRKFAKDEKNGKHVKIRKGQVEKEKYEGFPRPGGDFVAPGNKRGLSVPSWLQRDHDDGGLLVRDAGVVSGVVTRFLFPLTSSLSRLNSFWTVLVPVFRQWDLFGVVDSGSTVPK